MKNLTPTKSKWKLLIGNGEHFATINTKNKRLATIDIDSYHDLDEFEDNAKLIASAKDNYETLLLIKKEINKALEKNIVNNEEVDFKKLIGAIGDVVSKAIINTKNK